MAPTEVAELFATGRRLHQAGRLVEAESYYRRVLAAQPNHADALNLLGIIAHRSGRHELAIKAIRQAIEQNGEHPGYISNLGNVLHGQGQLDEAIVAYRKAISIKPDYAEAYFNLGVALAEKQKPDEAIAAFRRAISIKPDFAEAEQKLGLALREQGKLAEAVAAYRRTIGIRPSDSTAHLNLGVALKELGEIDASRQAFEKALELAPRNAMAYRFLGETKRFCTGDPRLNAMEELAREVKSLAPEAQIDLHFALAKAHDDLGDYERSFAHLLEGNALKRRQFIFDDATIHDLFGRIRHVFSRSLMAEKRDLGEPSSVPTFIIGMPRSGTTLIEQILSSHPQVFGAGELVKLATVVDRLCQPVPFPEAIASMGQQELLKIGRSYLAEVQQLAPKAERITDKLPGNFRFAGLIHLALPNARIVHARRDALDTCLSCFATLFAGPLTYTYDLAELGRFYREYEAMMEHWRSVLPPGVMLEVQYENLVSDLEGEARRIIAHCGLEWDEACLAFHNAQRPVLTSSAVQVRQPIYRSSIGRWRNYERQLAPLIAVLGQNLPRGHADSDAKPRR